MNIINHDKKHILCVLLVDTSSSMSGDAMDRLNEGLRVFGKALQEYPKGYRCTDICVVKFDSTVDVIVPFTSAAEYHAPVLTAADSPNAAMNEAILTGLNLIEPCKSEFKSIGVDYGIPWMLLLTNCVPTDTTLNEDAHSRLQESLAKRKIMFVPTAIGDNAHIADLKTYTRDGAGLVLKAETAKSAVTELARIIFDIPRGIEEPTPTDITFIF